NWRLQLGTLGGGNHFIEVCLDETDKVWTFLHSGSRGIGNKIAQYHIDTAKNLRHQAADQLPHPDLAWLTEGTDQFARYIAQLWWAQHFAVLYREEMMFRVNYQLGRWAGEPVQSVQHIDSHH